MRIDLDDGTRVLRVYEQLLDGQTDATLDDARKVLRRHGFVLEPDGQIRSETDLAKVPPKVPRSLAGLRDPRIILDSLERIERALPADPAQAIGSAKELIEATAKTVLIERGVPFDDKTAKLPALVDLAQRELYLHPQQATAGPDGGTAVKRILGGLISIAVGLGEMRNAGWGTAHAPAAHRCAAPPAHPSTARPGRRPPGGNDAPAMPRWRSGRYSVPRCGRAQCPEISRARADICQ